MPLNKDLGKQGCCCQFRITRYLTLTKIGWATFTLQFLFMFIRISSASLFVASFLFIIYQLLFITLPVVLYSDSFVLFDHFEFVSVSVLFCSVSIWLFVIQYSVLFSVLILKMYSKYFNPHNNNHLASQQTWYHKTAPSFVLVKEARAYYCTIIVIRGISGTNFSNWVRRGWDKNVITRNIIIWW
jgi:hypothetical protein